MARNDLTDDQNQFRDLILAAIKVEKLLIEFPDRYRKFIADAGKSKNVSAEAMQRSAQRKALAHIDGKIIPAIYELAANRTGGLNAGVRHINSVYEINLSEVDESGLPTRPNAGEVILSKKKGKFEAVRTSVHRSLSEQFEILASEFSELEAGLRDCAASLVDGEVGPYPEVFSTCADSVGAIFNRISQISQDYPRIFDGMFTHSQNRAISRDSR